MDNKPINWLWGIAWAIVLFIISEIIGAFIFYEVFKRRGGCPFVAGRKK